MKHFRLSLAVAGVLAAGNAAAFAPVWPADGDAPDGTDSPGSVVIWHSGATASNASLQDAVVSTLCDATDLAARPISVLEDLAATGSNFWTVACTGKATLSANLAGFRILWNKRNEGGSGVGVQPVATSTLLGFMKPSTGVGNNCPAQTTTRTVGGVAGVAIYPCTNFNYPSSINEPDAASDAVIRVPDVGTADIEADKFTFAENISASDFNLDGIRPDPLVNSVAGLVQSDLAQLVFGVYGNLLMVQDFQRAQFPLGHPDYDRCNPAGALYLKVFDNEGGPDVLISNLGANANRERCMPSLSSAELRSIFGSARAIRQAGDFQAETAYRGGTFAAMVATGVSGGTVTAQQDIIACRRVKGSGTQAQFNAMIMGYPCDPNSDGGIDTLVPAAESALTPNIKENEGSSDVDRCVQDYNDATNASTKNASLLRRWAIGIGSTERNTSLALPFRYFKLDGFAPTLVNVHAGDYYNFAQQVLLRRTSVVGSVLDAYNALVPSLSTAAGAGALGRTHAFGRAGWLSVPSATNSPTSELSFTTPVNWFRKVSATGLPNTCALPSAFRPSTGTDITAAPQNCSSDNGSGDQNCYTP